ncbi:MAG: hypothetical protein AB1522_08230 [Chloroflexota bacterium]
MTDNSTPQTRALVIGNDSRLLYLLNRYARLSGLELISSTTTAALAEINNANPAFLIFSSLDALKECHNWLASLNDREIKIIVCTAIGEEATARELGADQCIFHPLTYSDFCSALGVNLAGHGLNPA